MIHIKTDSRKVKKGDTFVAIKGYTVDGHNYIEKAILNGATKIVCEHGSYEVETLVVLNTKDWLKEYLIKNYQEEIKKLTLIGVTGTNGKKTTCFLTYQMLKKLKINAAYIGTIGFFIGEEKRELQNTTPEILELYSMLIECIEKKITHVAMEISSHSLIEKRIEGLEFQVEVFTNLTEDHLDFHKTMENYLQAKLYILDQLKKDGLIIVNQDDPYSSYFMKKNYKTLGFKGEDYRILNYKDTKTGMEIAFFSSSKEYKAKTRLKSKFNVYNYISSFAVLHSLGFREEEILSISYDIHPPKGRCEQIAVNKGLAIIDYAHTPDAVEKIIDAFLEKKEGRIITIIGCGGNRDPLKRPIMGDIATKKSDYVIFTSDNPRCEDPDKILEDITSELSASNYEIERDRKKAIEKGLSKMKPKDILLILGKGHEDYQIIGHEKIHFDDVEEVQKYIQNKKDFS